MRTLLLLAILLLHGCAYLDVLGGDPRPRIDRWVEERQYGKALSLLKRIPPDHPGYSALQGERKRIEGLAAAYEDEVLKRAEKLAADQRWAEALALYQAGVDNYPDGARLRKALEKLRSRQETEAVGVEEELLLQRAAWLAKTLPLYQKLASTKPGSADARRRYRAAVNQAGSLADRLYARGQEASEQGDLRKAVRFLRAAASLDDRPAIRDAQAGVLEARQNLARKAQRTFSKERRKTVDKLMEACRAALTDSDYMGARHFLGRLRALEADTPEFMQLEQEYTQAVDNRTRLLVKQGIGHYSAGRFEEALERWNEVLELNPAHAEAKEHLGRTKRILENLRELREKQAG